MSLGNITTKMEVILQRLRPRQDCETTYGFLLASFAWHRLSRLTFPDCFKLFNCHRTTFSRERPRQDLNLRPPAIFPFFPRCLCAMARRQVLYPGWATRAYWKQEKILFKIFCYWIIKKKVTIKIIFSAMHNFTVIFKMMKLIKILN